MLSEAFSNQTWLGSFTANLLSDSLTASVVGILLYRVLESKSEREKKKTQQEIVANLIWSELYHNRQHLDKIIDHLPKGDLVFPALESSVWDSIDRQSFIDFFQFEDTHKIIGIYARTKTINEMYDTLLGKVDWVTGDSVETVGGKFMEAFIKRCEDLTGTMDELAAVIKERRGFDIFQNNDSRPA